MNRINRSLWLAGIPMLALSAAAQSGGPLSFALERTSISAGEPVLVRVHAQNRSSQPLELDLGDDAKDNILIRVAGPTGLPKDRPVPTPNPLGGAVYYGWIHLEPGEGYSETLVLNEWFNFSDAGTYKIEMGLKKPTRIGGQNAPIATFALDLEVTPYDLGQLESACRRLAEEVVRPLADQNSLGAAQALRLMRDPKLVSFWNDLLGSTNHQDLQEIAVSKLEHLNNQQGVQGLAQALHSHNRDTRSLARSALERLSSNAPDTSLRSMAHDALERH